MKMFHPNICKFDFFDTAVADVLRAIDGRSLMGACILTFCCIDYMGMAIDPSKDRNTSAEFKRFLREYMGEVQPKYKNLTDQMWAARNSLIHVYGTSKASKDLKIGTLFTHNQPDVHLRVISDPNPQLWFNLPDFVAELVASVELFFRKNAGNDALLQKWYEKLLTVHGAAGHVHRLEVLSLGKAIHGRSHRLLAILDREPSPSIREIRDQISSDLAKLLETS
jgi:hypothetical protein